MAFDDYLAAEPLIVARIKSQVTDFKDVMSAADLSGAIEASQVNPAAHVVFAGERLGDSAGRGKGQAVFLQWLIVIVVKHAKTQVTGAAARTVAGPLILATLRALEGWQPDDYHQPLQRIQAPRAAYRPGGFAYFPLMFETRINT